MAIATLRAAFVQLANADKSGARVEDLPLAESRRGPRRGTRRGRRPGRRTPSAPRRFRPAGERAQRRDPPTLRPRASPGSPTVDDDMIELFFDEATERVEALAGKLVEIERRPDDRRATARRVPRHAHRQGQLGDGRAAAGQSARARGRGSGRSDPRRGARRRRSGGRRAARRARRAARHARRRPAAASPITVRSGAGRRAPAQPGCTGGRRVARGRPRRSRADAPHADAERARPRSASTSTSSTG